MVFEGLEKYKEEKISDHEYTANSQDMFSIEAVERGVDYELEKKGFNTIHRDFTEKDSSTKMVRFIVIFQTSLVRTVWTLHMNCTIIILQTTNFHCGCNTIKNWNIAVSS